MKHFPLNATNNSSTEKMQCQTKTNRIQQNPSFSFAKFIQSPLSWNISVKNESKWTNQLFNWLRTKWTIVREKNENDLKNAPRIQFQRIFSGFVGEIQTVKKNRFSIGKTDAVGGCALSTATELSLRMLCWILSERMSQPFCARIESTALLSLPHKNHYIVSIQSKLHGCWCCCFRSVFLFFRFFFPANATCFASTP